MTDSTLYMVLAGAGLFALAMLIQAGLSGWRGWLQLKHEELERHRDDGGDHGIPSASARIEIADLKERIRKLEAIAAGVDL